jgi:hypothetical protein
LEIGRISLATFLHLKTNELPEDRALSLAALLADSINLELAKMAEVCREQVSPSLLGRGLAHP